MNDEHEPVRVAVFGSSEPRAGDPLYEQAYEVGRLLAAAGHAVITGGYGGVMEAASRGARDAGGRAVGVTCSIFAGRSPNPFLSEALSTEDLHQRQRVLIEQAQGFIVLRGGAGTLAELAMLWALHRVGGLEARPVVLLGDPWPGFLEQLSRSGMLEPPELEATRLARSPEEAVRLLAERVPRAEGKRK